MKQETLIMGGAAVGILGLLWAASATREEDAGAFGGGGGYSMPFVNAEKGSEKTEGGGTTSYQIAFPDVTIPTMPEPVWSYSDGESTPPALPADTSKMEAGTYSVGDGKTVTVKEPFTGEPTTSKKDDAVSAGGFGGGGAGGRTGDAPTTKKADPIGDIVSGVSDFIGDIGNTIGGFFGW